MCGFFLIYVIPIGMHLKCLYKDSAKKSTFSLTKELSNESNSVREHQFINHKIKVRLVECNEYEYECVDHTQQLKDNKYIICVFYCFLGFVGLCIMFAQIKQMIPG